jgi:hypothetical protein
VTLGVGYDAEAGLLVGIRDDHLVPTEFQDFNDRMLQLDQDAFTRAIVPIAILIAHPSAVAPNAHWRKCYGERMARAKSVLSFFGLVTESTSHRGALTAIQWQTGDSRGTTASFASFETARVGAERRRGVPLPRLVELLEQAKGDLRQRLAFEFHFHQAL